MTALVLGDGKLVREANFQGAWYYSLLLFVIGGLATAQSAVRPLWRDGEHGAALAVAGAALLALLLLGSMLVTVIVALLPAAAGRG